MVAVSVLGLLARREQRTSLASTSQGGRIWKREEMDGGGFVLGPTITLSTGAKNARCLKTRMIYRTRRWS